MLENASKDIETKLTSLTTSLTAAVTRLTITICNGRKNRLRPRKTSSTPVVLRADRSRLLRPLIAEVTQDKGRKPINELRVKGGHNMPDNLSKRGPQDASRIDIHELYEVQYWTHKLGCTERQLKEAVKEVGTSVEAVKRVFEHEMICARKL